VQGHKEGFDARLRQVEQLRDLQRDQLSIHQLLTRQQRLGDPVQS
jgi:hypothetical protein